MSFILQRKRIHMCKFRHLTCLINKRSLNIAVVVFLPQQCYGKEKKKPCLIRMSNSQQTTTRIWRKERKKSE